MEGGIYLLLGSNLGDRLKNLSDARQRIGPVLRSSPIYVTAAWGKKDQPDFFNQVIEIATTLPPEKLLEKILRIEMDIGRVRTEKWGPRTIDIDVLLYRDEIIRTKNLTVPHPELQNRRFALAPLNDLASTFVHPVFKKTVDQLLRECKDPLEVRRLQPQH